MNERVDIQDSQNCDECGNLVILDDFTYVNLTPCNYCQIEEFIREIRDRV